MEEEEYKELDNEEMLEQLTTRFDNGVGEKDIKDLFRELCLEDIELAKVIYEETTYWIRGHNNGIHNKSIL